MLSQETQEQIVRLLESPGASIQNTAQLVGISRDQVRTVARDSTAFTTTGPDQRRLVADERVIDIMRENGATYREIADSLGLSEMSVWYRHNGRPPDPSAA